MRAFVRGRESGLLVIAAFIGAASGLLVAAMSAASQKMHEIFFQIPPGASLSVTVVPEIWRMLAIPALGGATLAVLGLWAKDRFRGRLADAIEANALHGGRLSARGSLYISLQTLISNGFGASVGLEAAYTQICGMLASLLGRGLGARRVDMRLLVGCGAAAICALPSPKRATSAEWGAAAGWPCVALARMVCWALARAGAASEESDALARTFKCGAWASGTGCGVGWI